MRVGRILLITPQQQRAASLAERLARRRGRLFFAKNSSAERLFGTCPPYSRPVLRPIWTNSALGLSIGCSRSTFLPLA